MQLFHLLSLKLASILSLSFKDLSSCSLPRWYERRVIRNSVIQIFAWWRVILITILRWILSDSNLGCHGFAILACSLYWLSLSRLGEKSIDCCRHNDECPSNLQILTNNYQDFYHRSFTNSLTFFKSHLNGIFYLIKQWALQFLRCKFSRMVTMEDTHVVLIVD